MGLTPRQLAFRLALWSALFAWALWRMNSTGAEEAIAPDVRSLLPPGARPTPTTLAPPIVDPERLVAAMDAASRVAAGCGGTGATLQFRVGPAGLEEATLHGRVTDAVAACLTAGIWGVDWPRGAQDITSSMVL